MCRASEMQSSAHTATSNLFWRELARSATSGLSFVRSSAMDVNLSADSRQACSSSSRLERDTIDP